MACRNLESAEKAKIEIIQECGNEDIVVKLLDLSSFDSIRKFSEEINACEAKLDILINNAGVMGVPYTLTKDGFESHFGINHLGHFLLTNLLIDLLKKSDSARIVVLTSVLAQFGSIHFDDLNFERKFYSAYGGYMQSKLANMLFTTELSRRLENTNVTVYAVHPGVVDSGIYRNQWPITKFFMLPFKKIFMKTTEQGAATTLYCALEEGIEKHSGKYFSGCKLSSVSSHSQNKDSALKLWNISEKYVGLVHTTE